MICRKITHACSTFILLVLILLCQQSIKSYGQDVYANVVTDSSIDFQNAYRAADQSKTNYAHVSNLLGLLNTSHLRVRFPESGKAGDVINVLVKGTGQTLGVSLLGNTTIRLYDSLGNNVATAQGSSVLSLNLLSAATGIYGIRFFTNPTDTYKIKEARIEFSSLLSVNLLNEFRVYGVYYQKPCPPIVADSVYAFGTNGLLTGYVNNEQNAVDVNPNNVATLVVPLNLLNLLPPAYLDLAFPDYGKGGDYVGFTIGQASSLLSLALLQSIEIRTYDETGTLRELRNNFSLADLRLLSGSSNRYTIGFVSQAGNYKIARARITLKGVLGVLQNLNVYNAYHYKINRPAVPVTASGPIAFCQGGSVTLTANDTLGAQTYLWNTGATTQSITVNQSGTYYVEVLDTVSCSRRSVDIEVVVSPLPAPRIVGDSVLCMGAAGILRTSQPYAAYSWAGGSTADTLIVSQAATYNVTVTDANGCTGTDNISVQNNSLSITPTITATTCSNGTNGAISLNVTGGAGNYSYRWSTGATASSISNLKAGLYTGIITDNTYGCVYNRAYTVQANNNLAVKVAVVNTTGCGKTDGKADVSVIGGSGSYTYAWSNSSTTSGISNIGAGIYTVAVTDVTSGCVMADSIAVSDANNGLTVAPTVTAATSCNSNNGAISLNVSGGSGSYTYQWSTGATTSSVSGLKAGTYYVAVKDGGQCTYAGAITVNNNAALTLAGTVTNASCAGKNGSIAATVTGGSTYTYAWSTGAATASINSLQSGTYILRVTENTTGCTAERAYTVNDGGPAVTLNVTQPACASNSNGAIAISTVGTYAYKWSNGSVQKDQANLKPGVYTVTVSDANGCASNYSTTLTAKSQIELAASPKSNTSCATAANGAVTVSVTGGTTPFSYLWSNSSTTKDIASLNAGTYSLTVSDAGGCTSAISVPVKTDSAALLSVKVDSTKKASCNTAANGMIYITATGGAAPYNYQWSNNSNVRNLANVLPGTYSVTVTDAMGCSQMVSATLTADTTNALKVALDSTKAAGCAGSNTGAIYITPTGGATPYTYLWSNTTMAQDLVGVSAGTYNVIVKDNNNCTAQLSTNVPVTTSGGITVVIDSMHKATCQVSMDGTVYARATGGVAPYTYQWSTGATSMNLSNVNPGTYTLTALDANGCPGQATAVLGIDTALSVKITVDSLKGAGCNTGASGAVYITASRGTAPYTYLWSNNTTVRNLVNVVPGNYMVTVTDAKGCTSANTSQVVVDTARTVRATIDSVNGAGCIGSNSGNLYVTLRRGVAPYTYSWSNGAQTQNLINVSPGNYTLTAGDASGCFTTISATVGVDTAKRIKLAVDSITGATCSISATGKIYLNVSGGKAPYNYSWSNGATVQDVTDVMPGGYSVMVTDANGCTAQTAATVSVDTSRGVKVGSNTITGAGCLASSSGSVTVNVSGGTQPYSYMWSNGTTMQNLVNVKPGSYTLTVTDAKGCAQQYNTSIGVDTARAIKATVVTTTGAKCIGSLSGSVDVDVTGGTPPYNYTWSNGTNAQDLSFVSSGSYSLSILDAVGCTAQLSVNVLTDTTNPVKLALDSIVNVGCADTNSGKIFVTTSGGVLPYTYLWSNSSTAEDIMNIPVGSYNVTVTDNAGCKATLSASIIKAADFLVNNTLKNISCYGLKDGSVDLAVTGGSGSYIYNWSNGGTGTAISSLAAGSYTVNIRDNKTGCEQSKSFTITSPDSISADISSKNDSCLDGGDGRISLIVRGGTPPYTYAWSSGGLGAIIEGLVNGQYTVTVTDANACKATFSASVGTSDCNFEVVVYDVITPNGDGVNDVFMIKGIEYYPNNKVMVFDKWGDIVFEQSNYNNKWSATRGTNGEALPDGTYYYVVKLGTQNKNGGPSEFTGFIHVQR